MDNFIKRGVTVYSFKEKVTLGELTWEDCIAAMSNMGVMGIEFLGQLFFRNCPDINVQDIASWKKLMWKYGTKTVAHDFFVDKTMFKNRTLTLRESVDIVKRHVQFAKAVDCPIIRIGGTFEPELFRQAAPICEEYGVKLGVEIHNGSSSWILPSIQETIEIINQVDSPYLGIIPDMSMFVKKIQDSSYFVRAAHANGVREDLIQFMKEAYESESNEDYRMRCDRMLTETTDKAEQNFIIQCRRTEYHDPRQLLDHMPYIIHIHGKFWRWMKITKRRALIIRTSFRCWWRAAMTDIFLPNTRADRWPAIPLSRCAVTRRCWINIWEPIRAIRCQSRASRPRTCRCSAIRALKTDMMQRAIAPVLRYMHGAFITAVFRCALWMTVR